MIGENKVKEEESRLLEMLEDEETNDQTYLRVIKTLGEIESKKALELLIPIVDDKDEETSIRMAVCFSLGEIGDDSAIPVLKRALGERTNFLLRKSALEALAKFDKFNLNDTLIESLKDPQWQIRMSACRSLGERKVEKAFPILKYKALKDPEAKIKKEALKAIGEINSDECREFLKDVYTKDTYTDNARLVAIEKLIEHNVDWIFPSIEELYKSDHEEKRKPLLDYTLKLLSTKEYNYGTDLYKKMLDSENYLYRIYAIKGIRLNNYTEFTDKVTELSENDKNKSVKKHALSTLEDLK
ncbi:MAG: hypothetical protein B6229_10120 [Spirochaetaceae bacterium 4572_7]|nr:MAG: hypothetical protein B6229_10120 [Spirochaetaceae bacterium 4572_7]